MLLEIQFDVIAAHSLKLLVISTVYIMCSDADISFCHESVVCLVCIAVVVGEFSDHHVKLFTLFQDRVGTLSKHLRCDSVFLVMLDVPFLEFLYPFSKTLIAGSDALYPVGRNVREVYIIIYAVLLR